MVSTICKAKTQLTINWDSKVSQLNMAKHIPHQLRNNTDNKSSNKTWERSKLIMLTQHKHPHLALQNSLTWPKKNSKPCIWQENHSNMKTWKNTFQPKPQLLLLIGQTWQESRIKVNVVHAGHSQLSVPLNPSSELTRIKTHQIFQNNNWLIVILHHMDVMVVLKILVSNGLQRMDYKQEQLTHTKELIKLVSSRPDHTNQLDTKQFQLQICKVQLPPIQSLSLLMPQIGINILIQQNHSITVEKILTMLFWLLVSMLMELG